MLMGEGLANPYEKYVKFMAEPLGIYWKCFNLCSISLQNVYLQT